MCIRDSLRRQSGRTRDRKALFSIGALFNAWWGSKMFTSLANRTLCELRLEYWAVNSRANQTLLGVAYVCESKR
eukprot:12750223-Alexandrium_andersonii.AAC.1